MHMIVGIHIESIGMCQSVSYLLMFISIFRSFSFKYCTQLPRWVRYPKVYASFCQFLSLRPQTHTGLIPSITFNLWNYAVFPLHRVWFLFFLPSW